MDCSRAGNRVRVELPPGNRAGRGARPSLVGRAIHARRGTECLSISRPRTRRRRAAARPADVNDVQLRLLEGLLSPVLVFTRSKERPVTIDEYVIRATGRDLQTHDPFDLPDISHDTSVQPGPCSAATPPCYAIENPCYPNIDAAHRDACIGYQGYPSDTGYGVYPRILTRERDVPSDAVVFDSAAFAGVMPFENLVWLVQYWLFYPYDLWRSSEGLVLQQHAGDWEAITVGFSPTEPLFVAYSSHCGGEWREWQDAVAIRGTSSSADWHTAGTHPVAWVAEGSHATYSRDGDPIPIWTQCSKSLKKLPHAARRIISFVLSTSEREVVSHELSRSASAGELQPAVVNANYLAFRGAWGVSNARPSPAGESTRRTTGRSLPRVRRFGLIPCGRSFATRTGGDRPVGAAVGNGDGA